MNEPKIKTVAEAAEEWLNSEDGSNAKLCEHLENRMDGLVRAFAAGVKWEVDDTNAAMRKRGERK